MADALGSVPAANEEYRRQLLSAMASGGSAGAKAFESGQAALTAAKGQAIDQASSLASLIGGPESQGFAPQAGAGYDRRIADLKAGQENFTGNLAARGNAYDQYLSSVSAAVPLVRAQTERDLALKRMELAAGNASSSAGGALADLSDSELGGYLFGAGKNQKALGVEQLQSGTRSLLPGPLGLPGLIANLTKGVAAGGAQTPEALGRLLGTEAGLDPNRVSGLTRLQDAPFKLASGDPVKNIMTWAKTDAKTADTILKDPLYATARDNTLEGLTDGIDWETVDADLRARLAGKPRTYNAIVAELRPMYQRAGLT